MEKIKIFILIEDPRGRMADGPILAIERDREKLRKHILEYYKAQNVDELESNSEVGGWTSVSRLMTWAKDKTVDELLEIHQYCSIPSIEEREI